MRFLRSESWLVSQKHCLWAYYKPGSSTINHLEVSWAMLVSGCFTLVGYTHIYNNLHLSTICKWNIIYTSKCWYRLVMVQIAFGLPHLFTLICKLHIYIYHIYIYIYYIYIYLLHIYIYIYILHIYLYIYIFIYLFMYLFISHIYTYISHVYIYIWDHSPTIYTSHVYVIMFDISGFSPSRWRQARSKSRPRLAGSGGIFHQWFNWERLINS